MALWKAVASAPPLRAGEVHLWRVEWSGPLAEDSLPLDADDRARAAAYGAPEARRRFAATRAALRQLLGEYTGIAPAALAFGAGPHGKPFLHGSAAVEFNVSHTGEIALLAFARDMPVGVDIERIDRPGVDAAGIAGRFFSPAEAACWKADGGDAVSFFRIWTRKEAVLKAAGTGWTAGGSAFSVAVSGTGDSLCSPLVEWEKSRFALFDIDLGTPFSAALAVAGADLSVGGLIFLEKHQK